MSNAGNSIFLILLFRSIAHDPARIKKHGQGLKSQEIFAEGKVGIIGLFISEHG